MTLPHNQGMHAIGQKEASKMGTFVPKRLNKMYLIL